MSKRRLVKSVAAAGLAVAAAVGVAAIPDQAHAGDPGMIQGAASSFVPWWNHFADKPGRRVNYWAMWDSWAGNVKLGVYNTSSPTAQTFTSWLMLTCPGGGSQVGAPSLNWTGITTGQHSVRCPGWATPAWIVAMVDLTP